LAEQLELDVTDTASYLEDAGTVDSSVDKVGDHPGGGLVEAAFAIPGGEVSSEPGPEHVVASARIAAAAHVSSIRVPGDIPFVIPPRPHEIEPPRQSGGVCAP
jgi:hypothetical protein